MEESGFDDVVKVFDCGGGEGEEGRDVGEDVAGVEEFDWGEDGEYEGFDVFEGAVDVDWWEWWWWGRVGDVLIGLLCCSFV